MTIWDVECMQALERLEKEGYMIDVCNSPIYDGDKYFETETGLIVKPENVGSWKRTGNIIEIMQAIGKLDELGEKPYDFDTLVWWEEEIASWSVDKFLDELEYDVHYA